MRALQQIPRTVACGFLMGSADVVPGVSGGTVALVLGIYRTLIGSVRSGSSAIGRLLRGDVAGFRRHLGDVEWVFLISLLVGIGAAVASLSHLIEDLLADHPVSMAGLFLGLVAGSVVVAWRLLTVRDGFRLAVLGASAAATFAFLGLQERTATGDAAEGAQHSHLAFFGAGAVAICAMILPGISGSFLLVMMGMYASVLGSVNERQFDYVAVFALGCAIGLGLFSQVLHWALDRHYDTVMALLIGLMVGSSRVLWPWPDGVDSTALGSPGDPVLTPVLLAVGAFVLVVAFDLIAQRLEHRTTADEVADLHV